MKNQKLIQFVHSLVLLPIITVSGVTIDQSSIGPLPESAPSVVQNPSGYQTAFLQRFNMGNDVLASNKDEEEKVEREEARIKKAEAIDTYFKMYDMPLYGTGMKMVLEAEKNGIDWRLLPAIAVRESTGGKYACKRVTNSFFGWGSCKINFKSTEQAIEVVAHNLGGNNPNTDHYYAGKNTKEILQKYNPPSIVKNYATQVMNIMDAIGEADEVTSSSTS